MIIRKPYAFLIKNFRKIHILLLAISVFIFYNIMQTRSFVNNFLALGVYDAYNEPISKYINIFLMISLVVVVVISIILITLLKHKGKPWKLYLVIAFEYVFTIVVLLIVYNYFHTYSGSTETATPRLLRDLLFISSLPQYLVFIILLIRIAGVDLAKFDFKSDSEYLELTSNDREEIEISIDIDKESFKRLYKRFKRNLGYFYKEHKLYVNAVIIIIFVGTIAYTYNYVFIINKIYKAGETLNTNNRYAITINNSYFTDKNNKGEVISQSSNFVILDLTIKNNSGTREIDLGKYHLMNGIENYTHTGQTYVEDFSDLGNSYSTVELDYEEEVNLILIYKVSKKLDYSKFVMYYQDYDNKTGNSYIRRMRLNTLDVSKIEEFKEPLNLNNTLEFSILGKKKRIKFDSMEFTDYTSYTYSNCYTKECIVTTGEIAADSTHKILVLSYASNQFDGKDMVDFSTDYGKISYIDSNGKNTVVDIVSAVSSNYYGKYLYLKVPVEMEVSSSIEIDYTIRNILYKYKLR